MTLLSEDVIYYIIYIFGYISNCFYNVTDDELTGGIPPVIFKLKSLEELDLKYNAITMVPQAINNLQNLKVLNLSHNPLLESLPGSLGHLPNIQRKYNTKIHGICITTF